MAKNAYAGNKAILVYYMHVKVNKLQKICSCMILYEQPVSHLSLKKAGLDGTQSHPAQDMHVCAG